MPKDLKPAISAALLNAVSTDITNLLNDHNLSLDPASELKFNWDPIYKCWEYQVKIAEATPILTQELDPRIQPSLDGRIIRVRILDQQSDLQQSGQDYVNRANNLVASGVDLIKHLIGISDLTELQNLIDYNKTLTTQLKLLDPTIKKNHELAIKSFQVLNSKIANILFDLHQKHPEILQQELQTLGYINSKSDRRCQKGMPTKPAQWLHLLEAHEARFTSKTKRDILFHVYPDPRNVPTEDPTKPQLWVINKNIPFSDLSSTLRNATGKILPNWYRSSTKIVKITPDQDAPIETLDSVTAERSSSFSAMAVVKDQRAQATKQIAENKLRLLVRNKIIETLNQNLSNQDQVSAVILEKTLHKLPELIKSCFNQDTLVMTLLHLPFKHGQENWLPEPFSESPQFLDGKTAFQNIEGLKLESSDIDYIMQHINYLTENSENHEFFNLAGDIRTALTNTKISHQEIFLNFATSALRLLSREDSHNKKAIPLIINDLKQNLKNNNINIDNIDFENLNSLKVLYNNIEKSKNLKILKTLSLYIKYLELFKQDSKDPQENFLRQVFAVILMNNLDKEVHITCKSGEDRTGAVFVAIDCALLSFAKIGLDINNFNIHDAATWDTFKTTFWDNYVAMEQLSPSREITNANAIGARGLQAQCISGNIIIRAISPIRKFFKISNLMAKIAKLVFKKYLTPKQIIKIDQQLSKINPIVKDPILFNPLNSLNKQTPPKQSEIRNPLSPRK